MNTVISPNDRVIVTPCIRGIVRKSYRATAIEWTPRGKLKVKADGSGKVMVVSSEDVKKVADGKV